MIKLTIGKSEPYGLFVAALLALGALFFATNSWFPSFPDEIAVYEEATHGAYRMINAYWIGEPLHQHPPLFDLILHFWLSLTDGDLKLLRVPSILLYLMGLLTLAAAGGRLAGSVGMRNVFWVGLSWPYGFHHGRLAVWYSCSFFLVALMTVSYLRLRDQRTFSNWVMFFCSALAATYCNYFAWPMVGCLAVDFIWVDGRLHGRPFRQWKAIFTTFVLLAAGYFPLWRAIVTEASTGVGQPYTAGRTVLNAALTGYIMFVSESVSTWFRWLSVPALIAIGVCFAVVTFHADERHRRLLIYFLALFGSMAFLGILSPNRVILISPWLLLPIGATMSGGVSRRMRRTLAISLALTFCIGWYGIVSRRFYANPRFLEPWEQVGLESAQELEDGGMIVANDPLFFYYLTHAIRSSGLIPYTAGVLPSSAAHPRVFGVDQWIAADRPLSSRILVVNRMERSQRAVEVENVRSWLDRCCHTDEPLRILSGGGDAPDAAWRIEMWVYSCATGAGH